MALDSEQFQLPLAVTRSRPPKAKTPRVEAPERATSQLGLFSAFCSGQPHLCLAMRLLRTERSTMATVRKTITLTDQQDDWIKAQVERGHYTNDSEYIRDLIRREQDRAAEIGAVRAALIEGEKSGKPKRFDGAAFKRKVRRTHG